MCSGKFTTDLDRFGEQTNMNTISKTDVESMMHEIGKRIGIERLTLGPSLETEFIIEENFSVDLVYVPEREALLATTPMGAVGDFPEKKMERLFSLCLDWRKMGGGNFSVLPESDTLVYARFIDVSHGSVDELCDSFETFVNIASDVYAQITTFKMDDDMSSEMPDYNDAIIYV